MYRTSSSSEPRSETSRYRRSRDAGIDKMSSLLPGSARRRPQRACILHATIRTVAGKKTDVQLRGVPVALRDRLRKRADNKGLSMSQYVIDILTDDLTRPTLAEWLAEVGKSPPIDLGGKTGADLVREGRRELGLED